MWSVNVHVKCRRRHTCELCKGYEVYIDVHGGRVMLVSGVVQVMAVNQIGDTSTILWAIIMSIKEMTDVLYIPKA